MDVQEEIARAVHEQDCGCGNGPADRHVNIAAAVMPVVAEALREAADEIAATFADPERRRPKHPLAEVSTDYANDSQWAELIVRNRADRIEKEAGEHD